jgi:hypothetical protein
MQVSVEIRQKLATLIGNLICRCIREARMIPYVLNREEVINLLVADPARFEKLVQDEHSGKSEYSKSDLTVKLDAVAELGRLDEIAAFEQSYWDGPEVNLSPVLDLINQLTRTFAVYTGNAATLFDKAFEDFIDKFRQSLQRSGMSLKTVDFTEEDNALLEKAALDYLAAGEFLQAFTYERLLKSQIMIKKVVNLPLTGSTMRLDLMKRALETPAFSESLVKFVLRVSYISQGAWQDLYSDLLSISDQDPYLISPSTLVDMIEKDVVFSCNLLCKSYAEIREWSSDQRRLAIKDCLKSGGGNTGF